MKSLKHITHKNLEDLVAKLSGAGVNVIAPVKKGSQASYRRIKSLSEATLEGVLPRRSIKEFFMPCTEPLLKWKQNKGDVELKEVATTFPRQVILGALPCDTGAVDILDKVMNWDYHDELWFGRRKATTVISQACAGGDRSCFCTLTGLGPDSTRGADILLVPQESGFLAEIHTEKGEALAQEFSECFTEGQELPATTEARRAARAKVEDRYQGKVGELGPWLAEHFQDEFWKKIALRCHGCGACAMVCPTCHCFDIVDTQENVSSGTRRRNWDSCQFSNFTVHGSGHNPREDQNSRFRQRIMHKFSIYPKRFNDLLCSGCGRCTRSCPGGIDLPEVLNTALAEKNGAAR